MIDEKTKQKVIEAMPEKIEGHRDVFISYKRENAPFETRLYAELERHNISAWVDLSKLHKETGQGYQDKIHKAIDSAKFFLLIYTEHKDCSVEGSEYIINEELKYAYDNNKTINGKG